MSGSGWSFRGGGVRGPVVGRVEGGEGVDGWVRGMEERADWLGVWMGGLEDMWVGDAGGGGGARGWQERVVFVDGEGAVSVPACEDFVTRSINLQLSVYCLYFIMRRRSLFFFACISKGTRYVAVLVLPVSLFYLVCFSVRV